MRSYTVLAALLFLTLLWPTRARSRKKAKVIGPEQC